MRNKKPIAVAISDIHFNVNTNEIASAALRGALEYAERISVPLVIAGDLNDTKAIVRAECILSIITILKDAKVPVFVAPGNHDLVNHHATAHSLEFLRPYVKIIDEIEYISDIGASIMPYRHDIDQFLAEVSQVKTKGQIVFMHQGVKGASMGDYAIDKSSIDVKLISHIRAISGHYHRTQTVGTLTYIGSPYTVTFTEANDGPKGFQVVYADGSLEQIPLNLRKHMIIERTVDELDLPIEGYNKGDLLWLKVSGPSVALAQVNKKSLGEALIGTQSYKLDKIPTDTKGSIVQTAKMSGQQLLDQIIEGSNEALHQKKYLKQLWRGLIGATT